MKEITIDERIAHLQAISYLEGTLPDEQWKNEWARVRVANEALLIIHELQREIERLKDENDKYRKLAENLIDEIDCGTANNYDLLRTACELTGKKSSELEVI